MKIKWSPKIKPGRKKIGAAAILLLVLIFISFSRSNFWRPRTIEVNFHGVSCIDQPQLVAATGIDKQSLFSLDEAALNKKMESNCIDHLTAKWQFPLRLVVDLYPKTPELFLVPYRGLESLTLGQFDATPSTQTALLDKSFPTASDSGFLVDSAGVLFAESGGSSLPTLYYPIKEADSELKTGFKINPTIVSEVNMVVQKMTSLGHPPLVLKLDQKALLVKIDNDSKVGGLVIFELENQINRQLASLQLILQKAKIDGKAMDSIDLRFNKPVVRYSPVKK